MNQRNKKGKQKLLFHPKYYPSDTRTRHPFRVAGGCTNSFQCFRKKAGRKWNAYRAHFEKHHKGTGAIDAKE